MPSYEWKGRDRSGNAQSGVLIGDNKDAVIAALRRQQIVVTTVKEKGKEIALPKFGGGIRQKAVAVFTRQFSVMIDAGLPLVQCLDILGQQQDNKAFQKVILQVRQDVEAGSSLADSLRKHPRPSPTLRPHGRRRRGGRYPGHHPAATRELHREIGQAEDPGAVGDGLPRGGHHDRDRGGLHHPVEGDPVFATLFESLGTQLPFLTQVIVNISRFLGNFWWLIFLLVGGAIFALRQYYRTEAGRYQIDKLMLKAPILGGLLRKIAVARFCRTLGTLLSSGVAILESLEITARTAGNAVIEESILKVRKDVEEGKNLAEPLARTEQFPPMVCQMVGVGEQTGAMDTMLSKIADFYEDEVDAAIEGMMALLEPVMIAFLGVIIGTIVVAMYLPMFSLISQIG